MPWWLTEVAEDMALSGTSKDSPVPQPEFVLNKKTTYI